MSTDYRHPNHNDDSQQPGPSPCADRSDDGATSEDRTVRVAADAPGEPMTGQPAVVAFSLKRKKLAVTASRSSPASSLRFSDKPSDDDRLQKRRRADPRDASPRDGYDGEGDPGGARRGFELIAGFEGGRCRSLNPKEVKSPLIIPVQPNTHSKLRRPGYIPESQASAPKGSGRNGETGTTAPTVLSNVGATYGLLRTTKKAPPGQMRGESGAENGRDSLENKKQDGAKRKVEEKEANLLPDEQLERKAVQELREESRLQNESLNEANSPNNELIVPVENSGTAGMAVDETERYRADVATLPNEATLDDYDRIPVSEFGAAVLRGMGWKEGRAIGRNSRNALVAPVVFLQRPNLLGLGAQPSACSAALPQETSRPRSIPRTTNSTLVSR